MELIRIEETAQFKIHRKYCFLQA